MSLASMEGIWRNILEGQPTTEKERKYMSIVNTIFNLLIQTISNLTDTTENRYLSEWKPNNENSEKHKECIDEVIAGCHNLKNYARLCQGTGNVTSFQTQFTSALYEFNENIKIYAELYDNLPYVTTKSNTKKTEMDEYTMNEMTKNLNEMLPYIRLLANHSTDIYLLRLKYTKTQITYELFLKGIGEIETHFQAALTNDEIQLPELTSIKAIYKKVIDKMLARESGINTRGDTPMVNQDQQLQWHAIGRLTDMVTRMAQATAAGR